MQGRFKSESKRLHCLEDWDCQIAATQLILPVTVHDGSERNSVTSTCFALHEV